MVKINRVIDGMFSQQDLPNAVIALTHIPEIKADIGDVYIYKMGVWQGDGDIAIMSHALRKLLKSNKMKKCVVYGKDNFQWNANHQLRLLRN